MNRFPGHAEDCRTAATKTQRLFTLARANRALVLVRRIVADVAAEYARLQDLQEILEHTQQRGSAELHGRVHSDMTACQGRLQRCLEELEQVGAELRDFSQPVVDFPAWVSGRRVDLCWQADEDRVSHWHEVGACAAGRRPIRELTRRGVRAVAERR